MINLSNKPTEHLKELVANFYQSVPLKVIYKLPREKLLIMLKVQYNQQYGKKEEISKTLRKRK